nr:MAG TPA: hypothetical protein [Caudoviricetes sp.]
MENNENQTQSEEVSEEVKDKVHRLPSLKMRGGKHGKQ